MLAHRISIFDRMPRFAEACPEGALAHLARFYYDTALSGDAAPLDILLKLVPPSQILFGTDYPYVTPAVVTAETRGFDAYEGFGDARTAVERGNAERLFPRLRV
jgi:predicted TIM-barrel fold metal-dependent hydrolase